MTFHRRITCILFLLLILTGCVSQAQVSNPISEPQITAVSSITYVRPSATATVSATMTATSKATLAPTGTATPTSVPTETSTPTAVLTLDTLRRTPPTLMLHRRSEVFDSVAFLRDFIAILKANDFRVVTYQDISKQPEITATEEGRLFIITIDDVSLQAPIDGSIAEMIDLLLEAGYPAVLGIITEGKLADEATAARLKELAGLGWELAMHTDSHANLHEVEQVSIYGARLEIRTCAEKIFAATGVHPITLVLPYGAMVAELKILYRENVAWVVGINGGEKYRTTNYVYYVGRESPDPDPAKTYQNLMNRFHTAE